MFRTLTVLAVLLSMVAIAISAFDLLDDGPAANRRYLTIDEVLLNRSALRGRNVITSGYLTLNSFGYPHAIFQTYDDYRSANPNRMIAIQDLGQDCIDREGSEFEPFYGAYVEVVGKINHITGANFEIVEMIVFETSNDAELNERYQGSVICGVPGVLNNH